MQITVLDNADSTAKVVLNGKLDISGAEKIALPLATLAGGKRGLLLDMTGVTFLASIGIRHLVMASKAIACQSAHVTSAIAVAAVNIGLVDFSGACLLVYGANLGSTINYYPVREVLDITGFTTKIAVHPELSSALARPCTAHSANTPFAALIFLTRVITARRPARNDVSPTRRRP